MIILLFTFIVGIVLCFEKVYIAGIIFMALGIIIALLPIEGFEPKKLILQLDLIPMKRKQSSLIKFFVNKNGKKYTCYFDNSDAYDISGVCHEEYVVTGNVKIYETDKCKAPVLKRYKIAPIRKIFSVCPFYKTESIFFIPTGTVFSKGKD